MIRSARKPPAAGPNHQKPIEPSPFSEMDRSEGATVGIAVGADEVDGAVGFSVGAAEGSHISVRSWLPV